MVSVYIECFSTAFGPDKLNNIWALSVGSFLVLMSEKKKDELDMDAII